MIRRLPLFLILPLLASCVAPRSAPVATTPPRPASPAPTAPTFPTTPTTVDRFAGDWTVADLTPGDWRHVGTAEGSTAVFAMGRMRPHASIMCRGGQISLARWGNVPADIGIMMTVRTSAGERSVTPRVDHAQPALVLNLDARDPLWDQIAYSRGRFLVEATRQEPLVLPTRPEIARVIEDCRR